MSKLKEIYKGWKNYIFENEEIEKQAKEKANICAKCDSAVDGMFDLKDGKIVEISGLSCNECGCPLATLLRSNKKCELGKW